ncbi:MAG TPA: helix-turn-helix transcriptional regulator, partial [Baekduia sp.]|nr:helix-turn-helix transcriptional regulator [Baekduia sp.]
WCAQQPDMVAHTGVCLTHRAQVLELRGAWPQALEEAGRARERCEQGRVRSSAAGHAVYLQAEVRRLRGELAAAETSYQEASRRGFEPQPGLALLWLARGDVAAAAAAIRRAVGETTDPLGRARLLPAAVEIMLAAGAVDDAHDACRELEQIARGRDNLILGAMAAGARGAVTLAQRGDAGAALVALRQALAAWHDLDAPYETARTRTLIATACRRLGDDHSAALEEAAAREALEQLGAAPDQAQFRVVGTREDRPDTHGLTHRELQVLRLLAAGATNRQIAAELVLSERTVHRHVSNIFTKLRVPSRAAATAYAYEHELL